MNNELLYIEIDRVENVVELAEINKKYRGKNVRLEQKRDSWGDPYTAVMLGVTPEERDKWLVKLDDEIEPLSKELEKEDKKLEEQKLRVSAVKDKLREPKRIQRELLKHKEEEEYRAVDTLRKKHGVHGVGDIWKQLYASH